MVKCGECEFLKALDADAREDLVASVIRIKCKIDSKEMGLCCKAPPVLLPWAGPFGVYPVVARKNGCEEGRAKPKAKAPKKAGG